MKLRQTRALFLTAIVCLTTAFGTAMETLSPPARALPTFALQTDMTCNTCHTIAPKLNINGLAYQANYFNWPVGLPHPQASAGKVFQFRVL